MAHIPAQKTRKAPTHKLKIQELLAIKAANPNITNTQIAKLKDADRTAVTKCFARYGISAEHLEGYKTHRADVFAGIQEIVASTFTEADIKQASMRDRTILLGTLYDKERLERGQSTSNQSVFFQIVQDSDKMD